MSERQIQTVPINGDFTHVIKVSKYNSVIIFFQAYKLGLYGPKIVWYFFGYYTMDFWKRDLEGVDCTEAEMNEAVEGSFYIGSIVIDPEEKRGVSNITCKFFNKFTLRFCFRTEQQKS